MLDNISHSRYFSHSVAMSWQSPWSGVFVIGAWICQRQIQDNALIVVGHGKHRFIPKRNTKVQISSFGTKIETGTCAICVRSHAQICTRKIQGVCVTPVIKNVMSTARSTCCHRLTKMVTPGTNISVSFGEILGDWMKHLQWQMFQIRMLCKLELHNCRVLWVSYNQSFLVSLKS